MGIGCDSNDNVLVAFAQMSETLNNPVGKLLKLSKNSSEGECLCEELWKAKGVVPKGLAVTRTGMTVLTNSAFKRQIIFIDNSTGTQLCAYSVPQNQHTDTASTRDPRLRQRSMASKEFSDIVIDESKPGRLVAHIASGDAIVAVNINGVFRKEVTAIAEKKLELKRQLKAVSLQLQPPEDKHGSATNANELQSQLSALRNREALLRLHSQSVAM